jgi:hypothetical protein
LPTAAAGLDQVLEDCPQTALLWYGRMIDRKINISMEKEKEKHINMMRLKKSISL